MDESTPFDSEFDPEVEIEVVAAVEEPVAEEPVAEEAPKPSSRRGDRGKFVVEEPAVEVDVVPVVEEPVVERASGVAVKMSALVYSAKRKNSESVAVLQKRLSDVGYAAARADMRGWFHDNTRAALVKWQTEHDLEVTGECAFDDMRYLFDGTDVEILP